MILTLRSLKSLLLSVAVLLTGHGLQLTLFPLKGQALGWSSADIGFTGSAYYLGFIVGCLIIPRVIQRVGHIRAFSCGVAIAAMVVLAAAVFERYPLWLGLRFFTGLSMAGLYTVIESWLNDQVDNSSRGAVLGLYTMISLGALALGQTLIEADVFELGELFPIAGLLIVGATLPVALTSRPQPRAPAEVHFRWSEVYAASHVGLVCAGISGLVMGLIWSLGAVYVTELLGNVEAGARFVMAAILGGLLLQFPLGRISDRFDRRWIILALGVLGALGAGALLLPLPTGVAITIAGALVGGAAMPMYAISIAHANDNAQGRFLQIASGMLMTNAVCAMSGPLLFAAGRALGLEHAFMIIIAVAFLVGVAWTGLRIRTHAVLREHFEPYQPLPKSSLEAAVIDPRQHDVVAEPGADAGAAAPEAPAPEALR